MRKEEFQFLSKDTKTKIHGVRYLPDDEACIGVIQLVHGMQEYIERYEGFAEFLTGKGFLVVGHDHLGHGHSVLDEQHLGYFCKPKPSDVLVADMYQLTCITKNSYPNLPYVIFGHSMGSYLLRKFLTKHGESVDAAILCGTGYVPTVTCNLGLAVVALIATFRGWHYRSQFVKNSTFSGEYKKYNMDGSDPANSWLSKNTESVKRYYKDRFCTFDFTLNGYWGLFTTVKYDNQDKYIQQIPKDLPIFFISGADDPVGGCGVGVRRIYDQFLKNGIKDVSIKLYENDRHEILNEPDHETIYADIWNWIKEKRFK